jgi:hypothetical protein
MTGNVTDSSIFWQYQGDQVLVRRGEAECVLTLVRVVDTTGQQLRLVNRSNGVRKPDWAISQKLWEAIHPAPAELEAEGIKWALTVK